MELITGATGYIGGRLLERLAAEGRQLRALARDPARVADTDGLDVVEGDLVSGVGLARALDGCSTAYYLVHSMEAADDGDGFADRDRRAAENFAAAAVQAGIERIVFLGGLVPAAEPASPHIESRLEVERVLLDAVPAATALRASIVIGARSSSFRVLVRLVERLKVLPLPAWRGRRTQPIDERDAVEYLARTPAVPGAAGRSLDIAGADVLSYAEMIERIAEHMGVGRMSVGFGASLTAPASEVVSAVTDQPVELVRPLMGSLDHDLLPRSDEARELYGIKPRRFDRAVERSLREWEQREELGAR